MDIAPNSHRAGVTGPFGQCQGFDVGRIATPAERRVPTAGAPSRGRGSGRRGGSRARRDPSVRSGAVKTRLLSLHDSLRSPPAGGRGPERPWRGGGGRAGYSTDRMNG